MKGEFSIGREELKDIVLSWLAVSVAFGWIMRQAFKEMAFPQNFLLALVVALLAVGTGFIFHELAHRTLAIRFGARARFIAWKPMLLAALAMAFLIGIVFAAPGAVYIFGRQIDKRQNGLISLAGPAINVLTGLVFFAIAAVLAKSVFATVALLAGVINLQLAWFNLIPIPPLDGSKVFAWNKLVWAALFIPLLAMFFLL